MKRLWFGILLGLLLVGLLAPIVLAVPGTVANLNGNPQDTSIYLKWDPAAASTSTVIRYKTNTFPSGPNDATSTLSYNGTSYFTTVTGLTAGQVYYFSAWGYDGASYSAVAGNLVMSTLAVAVPNGAADTGGLTVPIPTLPAQMGQAPSAGSFNLEPFTTIVNIFNNDPGGLGMPIDNSWETVWVFGIVAAGFITYVKIKNFFVAYFVVFVATVFAVGLHMVQGWLVGIEIIVGMGVWAIEKYLQ